MNFDSFFKLSQKIQKLLPEEHLPTKEDAQLKAA